MKVEEVIGVSGPLTYNETGSNCCGAKVNDPGNTGEWICTSCGEHCSNCYLQDVDVAVLNYNGWPEVQIFRIVYDSASDEYDGVEWCIEEFLLEKFGGTSNLDYMYSEVSEVKVQDYRLVNNEVNTVVSNRNELW